MSEVITARCCACDEMKPLRNIAMLPKRAPTPGKGWGCVICRIPNDGAVAIVCDTCIEINTPIRFVCDGYPAAGARVSIDSLTESFDHTLPVSAHG